MWCICVRIYMCVCVCVCVVYVCCVCMLTGSSMGETEVDSMSMRSTITSDLDTPLPFFDLDTPMDSTPLPIPFLALDARENGTGLLPMDDAFALWCEGNGMDPLYTRMLVYIELTPLSLCKPVFLKNEIFYSIYLYIQTPTATDLHFAKRRLPSQSTWTATTLV